MKPARGVIRVWAWLGVAVTLASCGAAEPQRGAPSPSPSPSPTAAPTPSGTGTTGPSLAAVDVRFEPVAELDSPLAMATREGDERLFVAGQNGVVWALVG
ncbi:MAG: hypothetical protein ABR518_10250, partial [Actinomycetota bacterium]